MSGNIIRLDLSLGYDHALGALGDHFRALADGRAVASRCDTCGKTWFPPHASCPQDGGSCEVVELTGQGIVAAETRTRTRLPFTDTEADVIFVLVAMEGADNVAFGRLENFKGKDATETSVRLVATKDPVGHPAQSAIFQPVEED